MAAPTFTKKTSVTELDPLNKKYGAQDWTKAVDILDGTHATERLQIHNIESGDKISGPANWIVRKNPTTGDYEGIRAATGDVVTTNTTPDCLPVIQSIVSDSNFADGDTILIKPSSTPYSVGAATALGAQLTKSVIIWGYGAILKANANRAANPMLRVMTAGKRLTLYGLTMDGNYKGIEADGVTPKTGGNLFRGFIKGENDILIDGIRCYDCTFKNLYDYGILAGLASAGGSEEGGEWVPGTPLGACDFIFERCSFLGYRDPTTGIPESQPKNNMFGCDGIESVTVKDCYFDFNKYWYITARRVYMENVFGTSAGFTNVPQHAIHAEYIYIKNFTTVDSGIKLRSFADIHSNRLFSTSKSIVVDGYTTLVSPSGSGSYSPISVEAQDETTYRIENVTLRNLNLHDHNIDINNTQNQSARPKGKVDNIFIENYVLKDFDANSCSVLVRNCDIGTLKMRNIKPPSASGSLIRVYMTAQGSGSPAPPGYSVTISDIDVQNVVLEPTTNLASINGDTTAKTATLTFRRSLSNGIISHSTAGSGTTAVVKFRESSGTATIASGSTTVSVNHNLGYTPSLQNVHANPITSIGSATKWRVNAVSSTQITMAVDAAPGGSGAQFAWAIKRN